MQLLESDQLQSDIGKQESCIFYDKHSGEIVRLVIREWVADKKVVSWADEIVLNGCTKMRNIRVSYEFWNN